MNSEMILSKRAVKTTKTTQNMLRTVATSHASATKPFHGPGIGLLLNQDHAGTAVAKEVMYHRINLKIHKLYPVVLESAQLWLHKLYFVLYPCTVSVPW